MTAPAAIAVDELAGANVPDWLNLAVFDRWEGWQRANPDRTPGVGLMREWALDESKLPGAYRRALDVIAALGPGAWPDAIVTHRVGVSAYQWRMVMRPNLVAWGWLSYEPGNGRMGGRYLVTVPVDDPPDRIAQPGRTRPRPVDKPADPAGQTSTQGAARTSTQGAARTSTPLLGKPAPRVLREPAPRVRRGTKGTMGAMGNAQPPLVDTQSEPWAEPCHRCGAAPGEPCHSARGKPQPVTHHDRRAPA